MRTAFRALLISTLALLPACGGGSSGSDSSLVIEGTLTENGGAAGHSARHGVGQKIGKVEICGLGECSTTDDAGQWGFAVDAPFAGGPVVLTVIGHGIDSTFSMDVPSSARNVVLDLQHSAGGVIEAHHITIDGETSHQEPTGHR